MASNTDFVKTKLDFEHWSQLRKATTQFTRYTEGFYISSRTTDENSVETTCANKRVITLCDDACGCRNHEWTPGSPANSGADYLQFLVTRHD